MTAADETQWMTLTQAVVTWPANQFIEIDGKPQRISVGGFGICRSGSAPSLGEALCAARNELPLHRGPNEQGRGFAAIALARANCTPKLMLCDDNFATRLPDPVLQQLEHFGNPALGVIDSLTSVLRSLGPRHPRCVDPVWLARAKTGCAAWKACVTLNTGPRDGTVSDAQAMRTLNALAETSPNAETVVFVGDGTYLMKYTGLYSLVPPRHGLVDCILDNCGFAEINKLQKKNGNASFNSPLTGCPTIPDSISVDFEAHARGISRVAGEATPLEDFAKAREEGAKGRAKQRQGT